MSSLAHALTEQKLARASIAEGAEEWIGSDEEEELASIAEEAEEWFQSEEDEDASANASDNAHFDASATFVAAFAAASEKDARASASAGAGAGASATDSAVASAVASAIASVSASAYFNASPALAAASTPTSALGARLRGKVEDLHEALLDFQAAELARRKADKKATDAHEAHRLILSKIRRCAKWTASLHARNLRLEMLPGRVGPGAGAGLRYNLHHAEEHGKMLLALESSAQAEALRLLLATVERAEEEARLAAEVNGPQLMVEGQTEFDRERGLSKELRLQDAHDEVHWLREETPKKLKGKKKKKAPSRNLRDEQRAAQRRAEAAKLVARLEAERVEWAREEEDGDETKDWRGVAQDDLVDSDEEPCFEDPRQAAWAGLPHGPRKVPKDEAVLALQSLVRAAAEATTTSGAGLAKKQPKVFDPGGEWLVWCDCLGCCRVMAAFCLRLIACTAKADAIKQWCSLRETK
jgi:hypothetical protein